MNEQKANPRIEWVKIVGGGLIAIGSLFIAYREGVNQSNVVLTTQVRDEWERRQELEMQPLRLQLAELDARLKEIQAVETIAKSDLASIEAAKAKLPSYIVKPSIRQSSSVNDIREIDLDLVIDNIGVVPVKLTDLALSVFIATPNEAAKNLITRTEGMYRNNRDLEQLRLIDYEKYLVRTEELNLRWNEKELGCPHGLIFAIDAESKDVDWQEVSALSRRVPLAIEVSPNASAMKSFKYLLTEYPDQHHRQWFRFR